MGLSISSYIIGGLALLAAVLGVTAYLKDQRGDRLQAWQDNLVSVTSTAAGTTDDKGRPALLKPDQVAGQIVALGSSVANLRGGLQTCNDNAQRRAAEYKNSSQRAADERARLDRQYKAAQGSIARLQEIARNATQADDGTCRASPELIAELEDLQ